MLTRVVLLRVMAEPNYHVSDFISKFALDYIILTYARRITTCGPHCHHMYLSMSQSSNTRAYIYKQLINVTLRHQLECFGISLDFFRIYFFPICLSHI